MLEKFGLIDGDRLPPGVPYLPSAGAMSPYGRGGVPGMNPITGFSSVPGMDPLSGFGGMPGANPLTGFGGVPGMSPLTGFNRMPGAWPGGGAYPDRRNSPRGGQAAATPVPGLLDGVWELNKGGFVIIKADAARLYVARDRYQDFLIRYDDKHFWWRPRDGSKFQRYRYEMREGRMVLADNTGGLLLLRRRR